ncbi:LptF/LptG family permease [bacterium]|nr:LptF/LptG family permease [bacterium]
MLKIIDRLILTELYGPFFFGVAMFSLLSISIIVLQETARFIIEYQLPASVFIDLFLLACPQFIVLSIPMGVLLGTLISVGRLNSDLEITALRTSGISLYRILAPYLVIGIFLSGLTFIGTERVIPYTNSRLDQMKNDIISGKSGGLKQQRKSWPIFDQGQLLWVLFADEVEGSKLRGVQLMYFDPVNKYNNFYVEAEWAEWEGNSWKFYNMRQVKLHRAQEGDEHLVFEAEKAEIPDFEITPESLAVRSKDPEDLTIIQLRKLINELINDYDYERTDKEILDFATMLHFKYSIPLTPLFFILIALPMAILPLRSSKTLGMGLALLVVFSYYTMYVICQNLGAAGVIPPAVTAWIPNAVLVFVGIIMMRIRERN